MYRHVTIDCRDIVTLQNLIAAKHKYQFNCNMTCTKGAIYSNSVTYIGVSAFMINDVKILI